MSDANYSDAYQLDVTVGDNRFEGKFRFKLDLSVSDRLRMGRLRRQYFGADQASSGLEVDLYDLTLATALSEIQVRVKQDDETPSWWTRRAPTGDLPEPVVVRMWEECRAIDQRTEEARTKAEDAARKQLRADRDRQSKESEER